MVRETLNNEIRQPESWAATLIAGLYFFLAGLDLASQTIPPDWSIAGLQRGTDIPFWDTLFWFGLLVPAIAFAVGWVLGFPRWSYPYTGALLVNSLYMMSTSTPLLRRLGYLNQGWGWRAWIPFLIAFLVGLLLTRSLQPARTFFANIRRDWTLATFAMFAWMPLLIAMVFDEIDRSYKITLILLLTAIMIITALLYMRAGWQASRARILTVGILTTLFVSMVASTIYWLPVGGVSIPGMMAWTLVTLVVLFYPALLSRAASDGGHSAQE